MRQAGGRQRFFDMLLEYSSEPDRGRREALERRVWSEYGVSRAVFVLDMSGFSQLTRRHGVVHYLSLVRRMEVTTEPIIRDNRGEIVKYEADNCFALFPDTLDAVRAAVAVNTAFDAENIVTPEELDIRVCCGIDYGDVLLIEGEDFFGNAVNLASKLGEDLAKPGEIIVTSAAMERIPREAGIASDPVSFSVSGISVDARSIRFRA